MSEPTPLARNELRAVTGAVAERLAAPMTPVRLRLVALGLALTAHAALFFALASPSADTLAGGGGQQFDAISVTIVNSAVLESAHADTVQPPAPAAPGAVAANDGAADSTPAPQQLEQKETAREQKSQPEPVETAAIVPIPKEEQEQDRKEASTPAPAGGVTSRGDAPSATKQKAPAAASAGAMREYAQYVAQALSKARPKGVGGFGTVKVKLVVAPAGGLAAVEIAKSSGDRRLDNLVLAAVQRAALPAPPPGMTATQLTYEVPYHFR